jgi:hypothetical protein
VPDMPSALVDFNERDRNGYVLALAENVSKRVAVGDRVLLIDADGNRVVGEVIALEDGLVRLDIDWSTWLPAPEEPEVELTPWSVLHVTFPGGEVVARNPADAQRLFEVLQGRVKAVGGAATAAGGDEATAVIEEL